MAKNLIEKITEKQIKNLQKCKKEGHVFRKIHAVSVLKGMLF